jgi:hypothetical protein
VRIAYADPPYPGQAKIHYEAHSDYSGEVDHADLIATLESEFDAWALHTGSVNLPEIVPLCPAGVRYGAWVKTFASFKPGRTQAYAWEPVVFKVARVPPREQPTVRDWIACPITLRKGLAGAKPEPVCRWVFDFLGLLPDDELHDLFPRQRRRI